MAVINYITTVQFGFGSLALLRGECERLGITKALVVTDRGVRAAGLVDRVLAELGGFAVAVFDETPSNPTEAAARAALEANRTAACNGIVAFGGGSPIDLAKGVALSATHDGPLLGYAAVE